MKKIVLIFAVVFLASVFASCGPEYHAKRIVKKAKKCIDLQEKYDDDDSEKNERKFKDCVYDLEILGARIRLKYVEYDSDDDEMEDFEDAIKDAMDDADIDKKDIEDMYRSFNSSNNDD